MTYDQLSKLPGKKQIEYEILRSIYMKGKVKVDQNSITIKVMIYLLCKNFGWTLEYVCNLTIRQIKFLFSGEVEYNNLINKSSGKSKNKGINSTDDLIGSKIFKVNKKRK